MRKDIMTLDQLVNYCKNNQLTKFSSHDDGRSIVVTTNGTLEFSSEEESDLIPVVCKAFHIFENRNGSFISKDVATKAMPTLANKPIVADIVEKEIERGFDEDGNEYVKTEKDFGGHAMELRMSEDGTETMYYIEKPVGIIPSDAKPKYQYDRKNGRTYVIVDGYIFRHYGNETYDILKRRGGKSSVSMEISINDFEFKDGVLVINDFNFMSLAILGSDVLPGMEGAEMKLSKFNKDNYESNFSSQLEEMNSKLTTLLSKFDINEESTPLDSLRKEDVSDMEETKVIEEVTTEDETITEEVTETEMSNEEVTETVIEAESAEEAVDETPEKDEEFEETLKKKIEDDDNVVKKDEEDEEDEPSTESEEPVAEMQAAEVVSKKEYDALLNEYEEYKKKHCHSNEEFEELQAYHDSVESAKMHSKREEILSNEKYSSLKDVKEFKELIENMDDYSLTDLEREAKIIYADNVSLASFSKKENTKSFKGLFMAVSNSKEETKKEPYGGIFKDYIK